CRLAVQHVEQRVDGTPAVAFAFDGQRHLEVQVRSRGGGVPRVADVPEHSVSADSSIALHALSYRVQMRVEVPHAVVADHGHGDAAPYRVAGPPYDPGRSRPDRRSTGRQYVDALVRPVTAAWVSEGARHVGDHHPFYRHEVGRWGVGWRYLPGGRWVDYRSFALRCYVGRGGVVGRLISDRRVVDGRPFDRERRRRRWF